MNFLDMAGITRPSSITDVWAVTKSSSTDNNTTATFLVTTIPWVTTTQLSLHITATRPVVARAMTRGTRHGARHVTRGTWHGAARDTWHVAQNLQRRPGSSLILITFWGQTRWTGGDVANYSVAHESSKSFWSWFIQTEWSTSHSSVSRPRPDELREFANAAAASAARPTPMQTKNRGRITADRVTSDTSDTPETSETSVRSVTSDTRCCQHLGYRTIGRISVDKSHRSDNAIIAADISLDISTSKSGSQYPCLVLWRWKR